MAVALRAISPTSIQDQSRALTARVLALPLLAPAQSVGCFLSMPTGEPDTAGLAHAILRAGKALYVPKIDPAAGRMDLLRVYDAADLDALPSGVWGIREPERVRADGVLRASAIETGLDVLLVPGLAFDRSFARLGHGKGYYDRFITAYAEAHRRPPILVALALREQLLDSQTVPMGAHDWKMQHIITHEHTSTRADDSDVQRE